MSGDADYGVADDVEQWFDAGNSFNRRELRSAHKEILKALAQRYGV